MGIRQELLRQCCLVDSDLNHTIRGICTDMMKAQSVPKPRLQSVMTPEYPQRCKRIIISDDYYPAIDRGDIALETRAIRTSRHLASMSTMPTLILVLLSMLPVFIQLDRCIRSRYMVRTEGQSTASGQMAYKHTWLSLSRLRQISRCCMT